jgi:hypothetical protein
VPRLEETTKKVEVKHTLWNKRTVIGEAEFTKMYASDVLC